MKNKDEHLKIINDFLTLYNELGLLDDEIEQKFENEYDYDEIE